MRNGTVWIRRPVFTGLLLLLISFAALALSETDAAFTPASPRVGDYVDITVSPEGEDVTGYLYRLALEGETVFADRTPRNHPRCSFRPRKEGTYTLEITLQRGKKNAETVTLTVPVAGAAPELQEVYSQKDGWWRRKTYSGEHNRTVESSGCALFALSHALHRMGFDTEETLPDRLAWEYHKAYIEGVGTSTEALVTTAAGDYGFSTVHKPVRSREELAAFLARGDLFTLGIVKGHVALADGMDPETGRVHIVDSAPGVTFDKLKKKTPAYIREADGTWREIHAAGDIPGIRWFFETAQYGGAEYWLDLDYCAGTGMRLVRPPWLTLETAEGPVPVLPEQFGIPQSSVLLNGTSRTVETRDLSWQCAPAGGPCLAVVKRQKGAVITDHSGEALPKYLPIPQGQALCILLEEADRVYVFWRNTYGYVQKADVDLASPPWETSP